MFLDVFWVLYPQNEEDSSQVLQNLLQGLQIILQFPHLPVTYQTGNHNTKNHEIRMERLMLDLHRSLPAQSFVPHSDRSGGALCRTYEATQPRLRRQWAGLPATCPSGTAGQETVGLFGWMWLYSPVNDSKAVSQTTHMDWILIPPNKNGESIFQLTLLTSRLLYNALYLMDPAIAPIEVWWVLIQVVICPFEKDVFGSIWGCILYNCQYNYKTLKKQNQITSFSPIYKYIYNWIVPWLLAALQVRCTSNLDGQQRHICGIANNCVPFSVCFLIYIVRSRIVITTICE